MTETLQKNTGQPIGDHERQLRDALQELGYANTLHKVVNDIPDARERLAYVGEMTERAANQVLNMVDEAKPACAALAQEAQALLAANDPQSTHWHAFAQKALTLAQMQQEVLNGIMMTQDFQDLSGQVINKVIGIISHTEAQLLDMLAHSSPGEVVSDCDELTGPQTPDKALQQDDVDDLMASLGF
jgi:chemotaxis protein CheZ